MRELYEQAKLSLASITEYVEKQGFTVTEDWNKIKLSKDGQLLGVVECVPTRGWRNTGTKYKVSGKRVPSKARYRSSGSRTYSKVLSVCEAVDKFFVPYTIDELQMKQLTHERSIRDSNLRNARWKMNSVRRSLADFLFQREIEKKDVDAEIIRAKVDFGKAVTAVEEAEAAWDAKRQEISECQERIDKAA